MEWNPNKSTVILRRFRTKKIGAELRLNQYEYFRGIIKNNLLDEKRKICQGRNTYMRITYLELPINLSITGIGGADCVI